MAQSNNPSNIVRLNGLSQDAQGRWHELLLSTQEQQQKKKKKCRGNRKAQHLRRRAHRQEQKSINNTNHMEQSVINTVDDNNSDVEGEQLAQIQTYSLNNHLRTRSENKRKCQELNRDNIDMNRSFSQLSISQENKSKKTKRTNTTNESNKQKLVTVVNSHNQEENDNELLPKNYIKNFKPQYLTVTDHIFKQMLSNAIKDDEKIVQWLNTHEKVEFVRQMTEVTNNLYYIDLQRYL